MNKMMVLGFVKRVDGLNGGNNITSLITIRDGSLRESLPLPLDEFSDCGILEKLGYGDGLEIVTSDKMEYIVTENGQDEFQIKGEIHRYNLQDKGVDRITQVSKDLKGFATLILGEGDYVATFKRPNVEPAVLEVEIDKLGKVIDILRLAVVGNEALAKEYRITLLNKDKGNKVHFTIDPTWGIGGEMMEFRTECEW